MIHYTEGIKTYNDKNEPFAIPNSFVNIHRYKNIISTYQAIGILTLMKQQYPEMNISVKVRKLLQYICKDLEMAKNQQGYGLIQYKMKSDINIDYLF